jgi:hypothetical protein
MKNTITPEQTAALIWFAEKNGRTWKEALRNMWMHGAHITGSDSDVILYALRNTHGPRWLTRYQPPKTTPVRPTVEPVFVHDVCNNPPIFGQPALPGAEDVRDQENATPAYDAPEPTPQPLELTGETVPRAMLRGLFNNRHEE